MGIKDRISKEFIRYTLISVFVTVIDMCVSRLTEGFLPLVFANTAGVATGFIIQYFLTAKYVYQKQNTKAFLIFLGTFLVALLLANAIVFFSRMVIFQGSEEFWPFIVSKGLSIVIPFFFNYYLRRKLMENC